MASEREPTREELQAMAYADGELAPAERAEFERQLAGRPDLALEVTRLQRLDVLARHAAGPEPKDLEWRRLRADPLQRAGLGLGWTLLVAGAAALLAAGVWALWQSDAALALKLGASAVLAGFAILLAASVRARLRTRAFDPYEEIDR
jgi:anti-sigma factor RsiW